MDGNNTGQFPVSRDLPQHPIPLVDGQDRSCHKIHLQNSGMNPIRSHRLVNVLLIQLVPYNSGVHKWRTTVPAALWLSDLAPQGLSVILKTDWKKALNASVYPSSPFVRWPASSGIGSVFSLDLFLLATYFKKPFLLSWHNTDQFQFLAFRVFSL